MERQSEKPDSNIYYLNFHKKTVGDKKSKVNKNLKTISKQIEDLKPSIPVYCLRPNSLKKSTNFFIKNFCSLKHSTEVLYSVKSNPDINVLKYLFKYGIKHFDVASIAEIKMIDNLFAENAKMYFMHPVKSRESIKEAYYSHNIRDFSLDSFDELKKILKVTNNAKDLNLHIRLSIPNSHSAIDLSGKFGVLASEAVGLIRKTRSVAKNLGICFHVGSQCMDPIEYRNAIMITKKLLEKSKVKIDVLDIGGGFPSSYPGMTPSSMQTYFDEIFDSINQIALDKDCVIWCEPGRALVAEAVSLVVRVEARKNNMLYLNDGTYGGLFDAGYLGFIYPVKCIRNEGNEISSNMIPFGFYGPTCDSLDVMKGPFYLPENISEGDYIEIGQLGAYSRSIRTDFNGFNQNIQIEVSDEPIVSLYNQLEEESIKEKTISQNKNS